MAARVTAADFEREVVEASRERPVLVDFWAPWCQPCLTLTPVVEALERDAVGRWRLAKVNVDEAPAVAAAHGVSSIPALVLYLDGKVAAQTLGALTRLQLQGWLDAVLPGAEREHLAVAREAEAAGSLDDARRAYEAALAARAVLPEASIGLARVVLAQGDAPRAGELVAELTDPEAARVRVAAQAAGGPGVEAAGRLADEPGPEGPWRLGLAHAAAGAHAEAIEALLQSVRRDRDWSDGAARRTLLDVLEVLGPESELAADARRRLAMLLF